MLLKSAGGATQLVMQMDAKEAFINISAAEEPHVGAVVQNAGITVGPGSINIVAGDTAPRPVASFTLEGGRDLPDNPLAAGVYELVLSAAADNPSADNLQVGTTASVTPTNNGASFGITTFVDFHEVPVSGVFVNTGDGPWAAQCPYGLGFAAVGAPLAPTSAQTTQAQLDAIVSALINYGLFRAVP